MEIEEVKKKRLELAKTITELILTFNEETGTVVDSVDLIMYDTTTVGGDTKLAFGGVAISLKL